MGGARPENGLYIEMGPWFDQKELCNNRKTTQIKPKVHSVGYNLLSSNLLCYSCQVFRRYIAAVGKYM